MRYIALWSVTLLLLTGCGSEKKKLDDQSFEESLRDSSLNVSALNQEMIDGILQQIPSPLEISVLLKESGTRYNGSLLNPSGNFERYSSRYKMALNLGVYGTDLGYTNIYEQGRAGLDYLSAIRSLADGLSIGQFFDLETIGRLAANSKNLDSLLLMTTKNFNEINRYLEEQGRSYQSVLLLTGGWMEAMNITCQTAAGNPENKELLQTVGEQKIVLEQIMLLLSFYKQDTEISSLFADLESLKSAYEKVVITHTYKEPTMEIVGGVALVKDNSTTSVEISQEDFEKIKSITNSIRTKIIS
jgi:hypothetical protein